MGVRRSRMSSDTVKQWDVFETSFQASVPGNPFTETTLSAVFTDGKQKITVQGFYDGDDTFRVRFMPAAQGRWQYSTRSNIPALNQQKGEFLCISPDDDRHGLVKVRNQFHFSYADGTRYYPIGTTCYAWLYQPEERQQQTLVTLQNSAFNKLRMCVFPKYYDYNRSIPDIYPYEGNEEDGFDYLRPNPRLFQRLEAKVKALGEAGIEVDLILFHPYEKPTWGFNIMGREADDLYLRYITARLSAFSNVWWSVANEWDLFQYLPGTRDKKIADWKRFFQILADSDPYGHLRSIHNCREFFDHRHPLITHSSIQRIDLYRTAENTDIWRNDFKKPVVIDECAYEGNIDHGWGNINGEEMTRRFWEGAVRGGYVGHGETYVHSQNILWWSHGGELHGSSPARIQFLRTILEQHPQFEISPIDFSWDVSCGGVKDQFYLFYFGFFQPSFRTFAMSTCVNYRVELIDTWEMTITPLEGTFSGTFTIDMPGKPYMAVRMLAESRKSFAGQMLTADDPFEQFFEKPSGQHWMGLVKRIVHWTKRKQKFFLFGWEMRSPRQMGWNEVLTSGIVDLLNGEGTGSLFRVLKGFFMCF